MNGRIGGQQAITRSLGDFEMKKYGVIAEPEFIRRQVFAGDEFVIIATDGLWDVVDDQTAVNEVLKGGSQKDGADRLIKLAMNNGTLDNITIMIISLK